jgi:hypothetical protein
MPEPPLPPEGPAPPDWPGAPPVLPGAPPVVTGAPPVEEAPPELLTSPPEPDAGLPFVPPVLFGKPPLTWPPEPGAAIPLVPPDPGVPPFSGAEPHDPRLQTARSAHKLGAVVLRQAFQGAPIEVTDPREFRAWAFMASTDGFMGSGLRY